MTTELSRNTFHLTLASIGQKLIAFVYFLFVARILEPDSTGTYFLAVSIAMIFSVIADVGMTPVVIREMAKNPKDTKFIFRRAFTLKLPFLIIGYACAVAAAYFLGYATEVVILTSISGLSLVLDSMHLLFYGVLRGHQRLGMESFGMFFGQITVAIFGGLVLWLSPSLPLLMFALVAGSTFNALLSGTALFKRFGPEMFRLAWDSRYAKQLFKTAFPFALAAIFVKVYSYIDTVFLSKFLDTTAVGLYSVAYKFTYSFQFLPLAFIAALYPKFSASLAHESGELARLFRRSLWYMTLLSVPIVLGIHLVAEDAVLLVGQSYKDAAPILSALIFVLIPIFLDFPIGSLLNAAGRQVTKTVIMGITMVINIILNAFFIPMFGTIGAAYAALISFVFLFVAGFIFVPILIPTFRIRWFLWDFSRILLSGVLMFLTGVWLMPQIGWIAIVPICVFVYFFALFVTRSLTIQDVKKIKEITRV